MKRVKVLVPFIDGETGIQHKADTEAALSEETIDRALAINVNMLLVLGDAEEPKKTRKKAKTE